MANAINHSGRIWKIIGPILAGALLAAVGYSYVSLEKRVERFEVLLYELNGLVRAHVGMRE
jgi:hypothetical protein